MSYTGSVLTLVKLSKYSSGAYHDQISYQNFCNQLCRQETNQAFNTEIDQNHSVSPLSHALNLVQRHLNV